MPALANVVINDGAATPVAHTYNPNGIDKNQVALFQELSGGLVAGYPTLTVGSRDPVKGGSDTYKVTLKMSVPKVITTTDTSGKTVSSVDYTHLATVELVLPARGLTAERKNIRVLLSNALLNASIVAAVDNPEKFW